MSKNSKVTDFVKRNAYYLAFVLCLSLLVIITVALVMTGSRNNSVDTGSDNQISQEDNNIIDSEVNGDIGGDDNKVEEEPTVSVILFDMPVEGGSIIKDYVSTSVVYNQTLGLYTGHKAIDFGAQEGAKVFCVYNGVVEKIETSKVNGTSVTIDHGNGLKSVYNSIETIDGLVEGATLSRGDVIGEVSTNNKTEYLDGAHLHFEVLENGEKVDPNKYLIGQGK